MDRGLQGRVGLWLGEISPLFVLRGMVFNILANINLKANLGCD